MDEYSGAELVTLMALTMPDDVDIANMRHVAVACGYNKLATQLQVLWHVFRLLPGMAEVALLMREPSRLKKRAPRIVAQSRLKLLMRSQF